MNEPSCLLVIDMQKGIFKLKQPVYERVSFIIKLKEILSSARNNTIKIIYTQHENTSFLVKGSEDWEIIDAIKPIDENDVIIYKNHPSIFEGTDLIGVLNKNGIKKLYVCGLISNGCIKEACLDGLKKGFHVVLISDAHSTFYKNADKIILKINNELKMHGIVLEKSGELW